MRNESNGWQLTQEAIDALLAVFHEDREEAACRYNSLRERLTSFFVRRQFVQAESLADEVLDRMARRITTGEQIVSPESYAYGVARFVAQEQQRRDVREGVASKAYVQNTLLNFDTISERALKDAMQHCLERHSAQDRELLMQYYASRGQKKIEQRQELALKLNLTPDGLRKHTFRLRRTIETCVRARLARKIDGKENG